PPSPATTPKRASAPSSASAPRSGAASSEAPSRRAGVVQMTDVSGPSALAELIRGSECTVVLTGAGISVPSGIPDFRTPETGLWANVDPMEVAHIDVFERDPE